MQDPISQSPTITSFASFGFLSVPILDWLIIAFVISFATYLFVAYWRYRQCYQMREWALKELNKLFTSDVLRDDYEALQQCNLLLKRVAARYYGKQVLSLNGNAWCTFLFSTLPPEIQRLYPQFFVTGQRALSDKQQTINKEELRDEIALWLNHGLPAFNIWKLTLDQAGRLKR